MPTLRITVALPSPGASDVGSREFNVSLGGTPQTPQSLAGNATTATFDCAAGTAVECWLVDIDNAGNRSAESEHLSFTATDTVPPPAPGNLSVSNVEQLD